MYKKIQISLPDVFYCITDKKVVRDRHLKRANVEDDEHKSCIGLSIKYEIKGVLYICIYTYSIKDKGVIAHETMHAVDELCEQFGIDNCEFRACMMEFLLKESGVFDG